MSIDDMLLYHIIDVNQHFRQIKVHYAILHGLTFVDVRSKYKTKQSKLPLPVVQTANTANKLRSGSALR